VRLFDVALIDAKDEWMHHEKLFGFMVHQIILMFLDYSCLDYQGFAQTGSLFFRKKIPRKMWSE